MRGEPRTGRAIGTATRIAAVVLVGLVEAGCAHGGGDAPPAGDAAGARQAQSAPATGRAGPAPEPARRPSSSERAASEPDPSASEHGPSAMERAPTSPDPALHGARTYSGTYSCDGCIARTLTVTILADGRYRLREVPARGETVQEHGRWSVAPAAPDRIVLDAQGGSRVLRRTGADELTLVDPEGRELRGMIGGVLVRLPAVDPLPPTERIVGFYRRAGARRVLVDCASGSNLVLLEPNVALDDAVAQLAPDDDENVLVVVRAHRVSDAAATGGHALVVDAFERATRDGRCDGPLSSIE